MTFLLIHNPTKENPNATLKETFFSKQFNLHISNFLVVPFMTRSQVPCWTQVGSKSSKQWNCLELGACSQLSTLKGVEGRAEALEWD
jgi:hypothetical protein